MALQSKVAAAAVAAVVGAASAPQLQLGLPFLRLDEQSLPSNCRPCVSKRTQSCKAKKPRPLHLEIARAECATKNIASYQAFKLKATILPIATKFLPKRQ